MKNTQLFANASYTLRNRNELKYYKAFKKDFNKPLDMLEAEQLIAFHKLFDFCKKKCTLL